MSKKQILLKILIPILMLLIMSFYLFWNRVPQSLSKRLSNTFQTQVFIGDAQFRLDQISLYKIGIDSPQDSKLPQAFTCQDLKIHTFVTHYLKDEIVIDLIELDRVYLGLEFDSPSSTNGNWTKLMSNLEASSKAETDNQGKTITIKKLVIRNIQCQVLYANKHDGVINLKPIDQLEFTNISSTEGFPIEQLSKSVLGQMLKQVFVQQNLQDMLKNLIQPQKQLNKVLPFKLF